MKPLIILPQEDTPSVVLDKEMGIFEISGISLPENACEFYNQVISWLIDYSENSNAETKVIFKLQYFNTSSSKQLIKILTILTELQESGRSRVKMIWYYHKDDEDMFDFGENFLKNSIIEYEAIPIE